MGLELMNLNKHKIRFKILSLLKNGTTEQEIKKVKFSMEVLKKCGQIYNVQPPKKKTQLMKIGNCYSNSITKMKKGEYQYVEGIVTNKITRIKMSHAWNVDLNGNHIDFTLGTPESYEYLGVIIPEGFLYKIGSRNGGIWYCSLPYLIYQ